MAEHMAVNLGSRLWGPYKELFHTVSLIASKRCPDPYQELEALIRKHKPDFAALLKNPAKNAQHREQVKKADVEGIVIAGQARSRVLPRQLIEEALIISDLFDLNEYAAVELLLAGDHQQPHFPGLTRGLVSVLLYYDGRTSLINALQLLIQSRRGRTWTFDLDTEVVDLVTSFTDDLLREGLVTKVLGFLKGMDTVREMHDLAKERALGGPKHRHDIQEFMRGLRVSLADCLYCYACQTPLGRQDTVLLAKHLMTNVELSADGTLDEASAALLMAFLYSIDNGIVEPRAEDRDELEKQLPILNDPEYLPGLHQLMTSNDEGQWKVKGIKGVLQLAWALTLRNSAQLPEIAGFQDYIEEDEILVDRAMQANTFSFLCKSLVSNKYFHQNEFYVRRIHGLLTDFIVQMPLKLKEIRNRGDEAGRLIMSYEREGLEVAADLPRHFEDFMHLLGVLYENDPLQLELSLDFWNPPERGNSPGVGGASYLSIYHHKQSQRQVSLFKFVRMAGDLLPPSLYVPYLHMLQGLANGPQSALQCFNLLKMNGMGAAGASVGSVSWDHFFLSLNRYYSSLRQEIRSTSPFQEMGQAAQSYRLGLKGITPHEMEGLINVLKLIQMVARKNEDARLAMVENQQWLPAVILFGLLTCSIPPPLKAECLQTLAVFAQSPEIAATLWQSLEVAQIIPTMHQAGVAPTGILLELEEIESNNEEYPLTRGFLTLMDSLTDIPVPVMLGVGYRPPGFDPYLKFLRDSVFLKFRSRAYRDPAEKWEIAALVTKILSKLLTNHEPQPEDFLDQMVELQGGGTAVANKTPGHHIMIHMLNDSAMLQLILSILDEGVRILSLYHTFPGKDKMCECALYCLTLLELVLEKQDQFIDFLRGQGSSLMVTPLDQLLMGINQRSGRADHLCHVAKFVSFHVTLPKHTLSAVKILYRMVKSSNVQPEIVNLFSIDKDESGRILHAFVESLEVEDLEEQEKEAFQEEDEDDSSSSDETAQIRSNIRLYVMRLLLYSLSQPGPNLTHYLLGYNTRKPVSKTDLQDPGVLGSPRTCLHAVIAILERGITARSGPSAIHNTPRLAEMAYELVYRLCADRETSAPTMRYLRTTQDFFYKHLKHAPFLDKQGEQTEERLLLNQQAWLLKAVAVELRMTAINRQRSHSQRLLRLLLEDSPAVVLEDGDGSGDGDRFGETTFGAELSALGTSVLQQQSETTGAGMQMRRRILQLLDSIDFSQQLPVPLRLEAFEPAGVEQTMVGCEERNEYGVALCNLRLLHRILVEQLNRHGASGTAAGQRSRVEREVLEILRTALSRNNVRQLLSAKRHAFDAWRQVLEVLLTSLPPEALPLDTRQAVTVEVLQELLTKVNDEDSVSELTSPVAGAFLLLLMTLRQCTLSEQSQSIPSLMTSQYVHVLDGSMIQTPTASLDASTVTMATGGSREGGKGSKIPVVSLTRIHKDLLTFITSTSGVQQRVRTNLYGALLNYLQIPQRPKEIPTLQGATALNSALLEEYERVTTANLAVIREFGEPFCDLVCRDACDGHELGRTLALSVIDAITGIDRRGNWLSYLASKGYLRHFIEGLLHMDQALQNCLHPAPEPMKALYIYESTMSFLTRVAETASGSLSLLQTGLMERLGQCRFIDLRPEHNAFSHPRLGEGLEAIAVESFLPDVMSRYRQLLFPVLRLCTAILTSLGSQHKEATSQVLHFVVAHSDVFTAILRDQQQRPHRESLEELALVTGVICSVMGEVDYFDPSLLELSGPAHVPLQTHLTRLHRQILALVPRFAPLDQWLKDLRAREGQQRGASFNQEEREEEEERGRVHKTARGAYLEIIGHVIGYCRTVVVRSGNTADECQILFTPNLQEAVARDYQRREASSTQSLDITKPPSLGIIVRHLRQAFAEFQVSMETHQQSVHKLQNIADLPAEELKELSQSLIGSAEGSVSAQQRVQLATRRLTQDVRQKVQELSLLYYSIECDMFLVWRHLEYYFLHCRPIGGGNTPFSLSFALRQQPRNLTDLSSPSLDHSRGDADSSYLPISPQALGITQEDLKQLRLDGVKCLNDALLKRAQEIESRFSAQRRSRHTFVAALARRIRRLLTLDAPR